MQRLKSEVVDLDLCVGCGVCAGTCSRRVAEMVCDCTGLWRPAFDEVACVSCGLCERACPFLPGNDDATIHGRRLYGERGYENDSWIGWFGRCVQGSVSDEALRSRSASGGLLTATLCGLLERDVVDAVWCVGGDGSPGGFAYAKCTSAAEVERCAGSKYTPVHLADVVHGIMESDDALRHAVVVLPCQARAIRNAQAAIPRLAARIELVLGLVCGQGKSRIYTEFLIERAVRAGETCSRVDYRIKVPGSLSSDYQTVLTLRSAAGERVVGFDAGTQLAPLWERREGSAYPCCFCDDVFAECADASFMDAWLPEVVADWRGSSLVVLRDSRVEVVMASMGDRLRLSDLLTEPVLRSQSGSVLDKSAGLGNRIQWAKRLGLPVFQARVRPAEAGVSQRLRWCGAFLVAGSTRHGLRSTKFGWVTRAIGRAVFQTGRLWSISVMALRRSAAGQKGV